MSEQNGLQDINIKAVINDDVVILKSYFGITSAALDSVLNYGIEITNNNATDAMANVIVTDAFDTSALEFVKATRDGSTVTPVFAGGNMTITFASLAAGAKTEVIITVIPKKVATLTSMVNVKADDGIDKNSSSETIKLVNVVDDIDNIKTSVVTPPGDVGTIYGNVKSIFDVVGSAPAAGRTIAGDVNDILGVIGTGTGGSIKGISDLVGTGAGGYIYNKVVDVVSAVGTGADGYIYNKVADVLNVIGTETGGSIKGISDVIGTATGASIKGISDLVGTGAEGYIYNKVIDVAGAVGTGPDGYIYNKVADVSTVIGPATGAPGTVAEKVDAILKEVGSIVTPEAYNLKTGIVVKDCGALSVVVAIENTTNLSETVTIKLVDHIKGETFDKIVVIPANSHSSFVLGVPAVEYEVVFVNIKNGMYAWTAARTNVMFDALKLSSFISSNTFRHNDLIIDKATTI